MVINTFGIIGAGSWGTTLAHLIHRNVQRVRWWAYEPEVIEGFRNSRKNPFFSTNLHFEPNVEITSDLRSVCEDVEAVLFAVPSKHLRALAREAAPFLSKDALILNAAKGLEPVSGKRLSQVLAEELRPGIDAAANRIAVLSGPNLAHEVADGKVGATVIAAADESVSTPLQMAVAARHFRVYRHTDRIGVELGGTLKNIFAIGAGIVEALELGDNARAAYLTRALHELVRLGVRMGGRQTTFYGLAGLGDLMATATSPLSRNHQFGKALALGTTEAFQAGHQRMVVEGVETARMAREWSKKLTIPMPITEEICRVLFEGKSPREAARDLMSRSLKDEEE